MSKTIFFKKQDYDILKELLDYKYITQNKYDGAISEGRWTKATTAALRKYNYDKKLFDFNMEESIKPQKQCNKKQIKKQLLNWFVKIFRE